MLTSYMIAVVDIVRQSGVSGLYTGFRLHFGSYKLRFNLISATSLTRISGKRYLNDALRIRPVRDLARHCRLSPRYHRYCPVLLGVRQHASFFRPSPFWRAREITFLVTPPPIPHPIFMWFIFRSVIMGTHLSIGCVSSQIGVGIAPYDA